MSKVNVILDGFYMFHRSKNMFLRFTKDPSEVVLIHKKNRDNLVKKLATDILAASRKFGDPNRVILTLDSGSWRKQIDTGASGGYKGTRVPDPSFDWETFWKLVDHVIVKLETLGVTSIAVDKLEADDIMYLYSSHLFDQGEHCIIISNDTDLQQLVKSGDGSVIVWDNNSRSKKVITTKDIDLDSIPHSSHVKRLIKETKHHQVDPYSMIFRKLLNGDGSDNVGKVYSTNLGEAKLNKIESDLTKAVGELNLLDIYQDEDIRKIICESIIGQFKVSNDPAVSNIISNNIKRNIRLMHLDKHYIPDGLISNFYQILEEKEKDIRQLKADNLKPKFII